jgi:indole-3-acetate monooxygenase
MYPDITVSTASALSLTGRAVKAPGGYRVSGRWPFASGCPHAAWLVGGCIVYDGDKQCHFSEDIPEARQCFLAPSQCRILDTWHTTGLRGSGSHDFAAEDVFVPEERTFSFQRPTIRRSGPLYAFPLAILLKFASVPLGIARAAIDELIEAAAKRPARLMALDGRLAPARFVRDEPFVQDVVGRAEAMVGSARSYLYDMTGELWAALVKGDHPAAAGLARWNLAMVNSFNASAKAVQLIYKVRGGSAVYSSGRLDRLLRDVLTINQHAAITLKTYELSGRALLGLEPMRPVF